MFHIHCVFGGDYNRVKTEDYERHFESPYCIPFDGNNVLIEEGDVVIDAGGWIGDFSAYAAAQGAAASYCFEPLLDSYEIVMKTASLNKNIVPVQLGLGAGKRTVRFNAKREGGGSGSAYISDDGDIEIGIISLDEFVKENELTCVNFIKADIEGFECDMLRGARETLARFSPKLSLCTYHRPNDPQDMERLVLEANPKYKIVHRSNKLYAWVPNR